MKKTAALLIIATITLGACGKSDDSDATSTSTKKKQTAKNACTILTPEIAEDVLGRNAIKGNSTSESSSNEANTVSTCVYSAPRGSSGSATFEIASVLVRSPKDSASAAVNKTQFTADRPSSAKSVSGYGQKAYWVPEFGQLTVLNNGYLFVISKGSGAASDYTLADAKKLADAIKQDF